MKLRFFRSSFFSGFDAQFRVFFAAFATTFDFLLTLTSHKNNPPLTFRFGFGDDLHPNAALARAVEFAEKHRLPASQLQFAVFDGQSLTRSGEKRFEMRVGIALGVPVIALTRRDFLQGDQKVAHHVGIEPFLNRDARRGVRRVNHAQSTPHAALRHDFLHAGGDVDHFVRLVSREMQHLHGINHSESGKLRGLISAKGFCHEE